MSVFDIAISNTEGTAVTQRHFAQDVSGLKFSDMFGGGNAECTFFVPPPSRISLPTWLGPNYDIQIARAGSVVWRGRIEAARKRRSGSEYPLLEITARGYGMALKDRLDTTRNVSGLQTSVIVSNAISNLTTGITNTSITATGYTLSGATAITLSRMTAAAQIVWASHFGDSSDVEQIWYVRPDADGTIRFTYKPRPTTPDWMLYEQDASQFDWGFDMLATVNRVWTQYNSGASFTASTDAQDTTLQGAGPDGWNRIMEMIAVVPEITQAADAVQVAQVLLGAFKNVRMRAETAIFDANAIFRDANGRRRNLWEVRAPELVQLVDVDPSAIPGSTLGFANSFQIVESEYDEDSDTLRLVPESFDSMLERSLARVNGMLSGLQQVS